MTNNKSEPAPALTAEQWRLGKKVPINVYEGDRPVCQCHTVMDSLAIVEAMNGAAALRAEREQLKLDRESDDRDWKVIAEEAGVKEQTREEIVKRIRKLVQAEAQKMIEEKITLWLSLDKIMELLKSSEITAIGEDKEIAFLAIVHSDRVAAQECWEKIQVTKLRKSKP